MAKRQPLNNRINKEDMFKKIMPSASTRPKTPEKSQPNPFGGDELLDSFSDDLIDRAVTSFNDELLDQLPSQPRVFATPAAPTAPVPPPPPQRPQQRDSDMPIIEHSNNTTVLADSASIVTDTIVIHENNPQGHNDTPKETPPKPAIEQIPDIQPQEPEEPEEPEHIFQQKMDIDNSPMEICDEFPPMSEGNGEVVNVVERIVTDRLNDAITKIHGCKCEKCRMDVAALALNQLSPQYVLSEELTEEILSRRQLVKDTITVVYKAAFQVKKFPRH